jgi:hypothetical protein
MCGALGAGSRTRVRARARALCTRARADTLAAMLPVTELAAVALPPVAYLGWLRYLYSPGFRSSGMPIWLLHGRRRYDLSMSAYSAAVAVALCIKLARSQRLDSLEALVCRASPGVPAGWYLSKYAEFLDTGFLVATGRAPSLLHLKHHAVAGSVVALNLLGRQGVPTPLFDALSASNAFVHAWMYAYYAYPRAMKPLKRAITAMQVVQHGLAVTGILVALSAPAELGCDAPLRAYLPSLALYAMWFFEFVGLFVHAAPPR